jgi:hypothetical protein
MLEVKVFCVNVGDKYPAEYVYKLKSAVKKHLLIPHTFQVYTDKPDLYDFSIKAKYDLDSWWNKLLVFENVGTCLYFDLDVIIHGSIDSLVPSIKDKFLMVNPTWKNPSKAKILPDRPDLGTAYANSSVMGWSDSRNVLNHFLEDPEWYMFKYGGDDRYLHHEHDYDTFNDGIVYSYRTNKFKKSEKHSIALFHQKPEIHECLDHQIVIDHWL